MRAWNGLGRRVLIVSAAMSLLLGLTGGAAEALSSEAGTSAHVQAPITTAQALSARRALVRRDLSASMEQAKARSIVAFEHGQAGTAKTKGRRYFPSAQVPKRTGTGPSREFTSRRAGSQAAVSSSGAVGEVSETWLTGPDGLVAHSCDGVSTLNNPQLACNSTTTVVGNVFAGETLTVTSEVWTNDAKGTSDPVRIFWDPVGGIQGQGYTQSVVEVAVPQTVDAPSEFTLSSGTPTSGAMATATFTINPKACPWHPETPGNPVYFVVPVPSLDGNLGCSTGSFDCAEVNAHYLAGSPGQEIACPGSPDSAGAGIAQGSCGDPVDTATGAYADTFTDAVIQSAGYPLTISRSYSSADTSSESLGSGWSLPWEARLSVDSSSGNVTFPAENGDQYIYGSNGDGTFTPPPGARSVLAEAKNSSGTVTGYTLTAPDHHVLQFTASGQLTSIADSTGRGLGFSYTAGQVSSITDASGHVVTLTYSGSRLSQVGLPDGKTIGYAYTSGLLSSVTGSDGAVTKYAYDSANQLASIQDPDGNFTVRNTYNSAGQVTSQED